ncbi:type IV pilus modification PilV family protein [Sorangium atrum]|uniref:Prepilin-type N-terminal cleavage/methylation domain-containing protein n=1 Tax=Sorangium atrum TaxID=2995308 RepID=A0ABT5CAV6_9BACT|nr:prepilin-type N-terminal cleavage/methylation domain-containing protein [Sorangium aterium]MDC0683567.1 prepilin-type N-terminal cleavage/methylation domain-containing protein [Sorangium aterium]
MSAARARRAASRGYTLIEVMAALGVLAIGATGVLALQKATLISNTNARNLAIANSIAMTWAERLRVDALQWNDPMRVPDIDSDTDWLTLSTTSPFPARLPPTEITALGAPDADVLGADIYPGDTSASAFCTHVRFRQFTDPASGTRIWESLIRAEIRVIWERNGDPINCGIAPLTVDTNPGRFGAVYLTTGVLRNTSEDRR